MKRNGLLIALGVKPKGEDMDDEEAPPSSKQPGESESRELVKELLAAIKANDVDAVEEALEAYVHHCFEEFDSQPHHEGEHY
jgi:DNA-binding GntR family transcriptional regulator